MMKTQGRDDQPRHGGATVSTEQRYRYPAEEIWEVADDRWRVPDVPYERTDRRKSESERFTT